jgi:hypothetical protein
MWIKIKNHIINTDKIKYVELYPENNKLGHQANARIWWNSNKFLDLQVDDLNKFAEIIVKSN